MRGATKLGQVESSNIRVAPLNCHPMIKHIGWLNVLGGVGRFGCRRHFNYSHTRGGTS